MPLLNMTACEHQLKGMTMSNYEVKKMGPLWRVIDMSTGEPVPGLDDFRNRASAEDAASNMDDAFNVVLNRYEDHVVPTFNYRETF